MLKFAPAPNRGNTQPMDIFITGLSGFVYAAKAMQKLRVC